MIKFLILNNLYYLNMTTKLDKKYLKQSINLANIFSKDNSTKVGCLIFDPEDSSVISRGYNGQPRGFDDSNPEKNARPLKYSYFEHAERNAIYNEVRPYLMSSSAVLTKKITTSCVRALICCGVKNVYIPIEEYSWIASSVEGALLKEAQISVKFIENNSIAGQYYMSKLDNACVKNYVFLQGLVKDLAKDPYAEGCTIIHSESFTELCQGYSGMPRGADDSKVERYESELRQYWVEGAVRNAVFNLVRKLGIFKDKTAAVSATSCIECARALSACGAAKIIAVEPSEDMVTRWKTSFEQTRDLCRELKVELIEISERDLES